MKNKSAAVKLLIISIILAVLSHVIVNNTWRFRYHIISESVSDDGVTTYVMHDDEEDIDFEHEKGKKNTEFNIFGISMNYIENVDSTDYIGRIFYKHYDELDDILKKAGYKYDICVIDDKVQNINIYVNGYEDISADDMEKAIDSIKDMIPHERRFNESNTDHYGMIHFYNQTNESLYTIDIKGL